MALDWEMECRDLRSENAQLKTEVDAFAKMASDARTFLDRAVAAEARLARAVEALKRYGRHGEYDKPFPGGGGLVRVSCDVIDGHPCSCGLDAALAELEPGT